MGILGKVIIHFGNIIVTFGTFIGTILLVGALYALPTMLLWDWLMPDLFGLNEITLIQAFGINMLSSMLFTRKSVTKSVKNDGKKKTINTKINLHD